MSFTISQAGTANSITSDASLTIAVTAAVGTWLIVAVAADNAGTNGASSVTTCTDAVSNTYTEKISVLKDPGAAAVGTTLVVWVCEVENALSSTNITIGFSPNTAAKTAIVWKLTPDSGYSISYETAGTGATGSSTGPNITTGAITSGDTVFCFSAHEYGTYNTVPATVTGDSDTSNGSWSSVYRDTALGAGYAGQIIASQYKTTTGTSSQVWGITVEYSSDWAVNWLSFTSELLPASFVFKLNPLISLLTR